MTHTHAPSASSAPAGGPIKPFTPAIDDFTAIYELHHDAIFRYCYWKSRDREVGQDLMQETFLRYCICLQNGQKILQTRAFLYRIAHNLFINHVRRKKEASLDGLLETGFEPAVDAWHITNSHLDAEKPLKKLAEMLSPYRDVLHRRFILGLPPAEIARLTGETPNTVSVRIFRGLKHLRLLLEADGVDAGDDSQAMDQATLPPLLALA